MSDLNIYQRINAVMKEVEYVKKDASVQGYKAVSHDQVVSVARGAFVKHGIVVFPKQISGQLDEPVKDKEGVPAKMRMYHGWYYIHFLNSDNPSDLIKVKIESHALDNGDKAPGKALTYATKAAILKVLCLETGENDESRAEAHKPLTELQAQTIKKEINGNREIEGRIFAMYDVEAIEELPKSEYARILSAVKQFNKGAA